MIPKKQMIVFSLLIVTLVVGASLGWRSFNGKAGQPVPRRFGEQALKVNGAYVAAEIFQQEQKRFYERGKRNGYILRLSDEERNDLLLEEVIDRVIMETYLREQSAVKISPQEVKDYINRYVRPFYPTETAMQAYLEKVYCADEAQLQRLVEVYLLQLKYLPELAGRYGISVSEAEVAERERRQKAANRKVKLSHILIAPRDRSAKEAEELALEVYQQLKAGGPFQTAVKQYSDDPQTKDKGGQLGVLTLSEVPPELVREVLNAPAGALIQPVNTRYGWEILKVDAWIDFTHPRAELRNMIAVEKFLASNQYHDWCNQLKTKIKVEVTEPCLLAYRCFKAKKYSKAGQLYENSYQLYQVEFYLNRALESYLAAKRWGKLVELGRLGIKKSSNQVPYYLYTAEGLYRKSHRTEALQLLTKAKTMAAGNVVLKNMVNQVYDRLGLTE